MKHLIWLIVLPLATCVLMGPNTTLSATVRCSVTEASSAGGTVRVHTNPVPEGWPLQYPLQIVWEPPRSALGPILVVAYGDGAMAMPIGGHIRFHISPSTTTTDDTRVTLSGPGGQTVTLGGEELRYGFDFGSSDETRPAMDVAFGGRGAHWAAISEILTEGNWIGVKLVRNGGTVVETVFDLSNLEARNALLTAARAKVEAEDPRVCTGGSTKAP